MTNKIKDYISALEEARNVTVLWACETGSRAWGFPSTDSDYDIRLIYVHRKDWYVSLSEKKDSIELMLENNEIDISGWELKKSMNLLRKSNAALLERIQSPIVYKSDEEFIQEVRKVGQSCYSKIATIHHYLSMSKKFLEDLKAEDKFKLKKFFYTMRSAFVCKWILEKEEMPPIEFDKIYNNLGLGNPICERIEDLIELKANIKESYFHRGEKDLLDIIESFIVEADEKRINLPSSKVDFESMNQLFKKYVDKYDNQGNKG